MCNTNITILCWFNSGLTIEKDNNSNYIKGIVKPIFCIDHQNCGVLNTVVLNQLPITMVLVTP